MIKRDARFWRTFVLGWVMVVVIFTTIFVLVPIGLKIWYLVPECLREGRPARLTAYFAFGLVFYAVVATGWKLAKSILRVPDKDPFGLKRTGQPGVNIPDYPASLIDKTRQDRSDP